MEKTFTLEQVLDLLLSIQQCSTPFIFRGSKNLESTDFVDLATSKAMDLGIKKEFEDYYYSNTNILDEFKKLYNDNISK